MKQMTIDEALNQLYDFIQAYENEEIRRSITVKHGNIDNVTRDYKATKLLIEEYLQLRDNVVQLAIESVEREKTLARLENEVECLRDMVLIQEIKAKA